MKTAPVLAALLAATPLAAAPSVQAQSPDWSRAPAVTVTLLSFAFNPAEIHLHAGQPVVLHLVNAASGGHNFAAPEFFGAAIVRPADRALLRNGAVELGSHQSRDIALVPVAGRYKLKCTHMMHSAFGMHGEIVVG